MAGRGKQPVTAQEVEKFAKDLRARAALIANLAKVLREKDGEQVEAMGGPMVERSLKYIDGFILSLKRELGEL